MEVGYSFQTHDVTLSVPVPRTCAGQGEASTWIAFFSLFLWVLCFLDWWWWLIVEVTREPFQYFVKFSLHFLASGGLLSWMTLCLVGRQAGKKPGYVISLGLEHRYLCCFSFFSPNVALTLGSARRGFKLWLHQRNCSITLLFTLPPRLSFFSVTGTTPDLGDSSKNGVHIHL